MFGHKAETYETKNSSRKWGKKKTTTLPLTDDDDTAQITGEHDLEQNEPDSVFANENVLGSTESSEESNEPPGKKSNKKHKPKKPKSGLPFWKDKKKIGILLISLSLLVMLVISPALNYVTTTKMGTSVVAKSDISKGTLITDEMLASVTVPEAAMLPIFIRDKTEAIGKYAKTDITKDEQITGVKLDASLPFDNSYLYTLPVNKKAISITISSLAAGLSGKLQTGDIVTLYISFNEKESKEADANPQDEYTAKLLPELMYMRVLSTTDADGFDAKPIPQNAGTAEVAAVLPVTITLAADDMQACTLAGLEQKGQIHAALAFRGDVTEAEALISTQDNYLIQKKAEDAAKEKAKAEAEISAPLEPESTPPIQTEEVTVK